MDADEVEITMLLKYEMTSFINVFSSYWGGERLHQQPRNNNTFQIWIVIQFAYLMHASHLFFSLQQTIIIIKVR